MLAFSRRLWILPFLFLFFSIYPPHSFAEDLAFVLDPEKTLVEFKVKAMFHMVHGISTEESSGEFDVDKLTRKVRLPVVTRMKVKTFKTGIYLRDETMYEMFEADEFPYITGRIDEFDCPELPEKGEVVCFVSGGLTIRDIEQPMSFAAKLYRDGQTVTVEGNFMITRTQFELNPPSFYGLFRVSKNVNIHILTTWHQKG